LSFGKNLEISVLLDFYSALLNDKQRDFIDLYYNEDLSLAEIAEHESITRQGVRDCIKRGEQILLDAENALGLAEKHAGWRRSPTGSAGMRILLPPTR